MRFNLRTTTLVGLTLSLLTILSTTHAFAQFRCSQTFVNGANASPQRISDPDLQKFILDTSIEPVTVGSKRVRTRMGYVTRYEVNPTLADGGTGTVSLFFGQAGRIKFYRFDFMYFSSAEGPRTDMEMKFEEVLQPTPKTRNLVFSRDVKIGASVFTLVAKVNERYFLTGGTWETEDVTLSATKKESP